MNYILFSIFVIGFSYIPFYGNIGPDGFYQFKKRIFVETGTLGGEAILKAKDAGFQEIYSMDIDENCFKYAKIRFENDSNVHLFLGNSEFELWDVIKNIQEPSVFWLDAHNGFPDPNKTDIKNTPLIEELDQIKHHPIKNHTILIDDLHCCNTLLFDYLSLDDIINKVLEVNPEYQISFVDGGDDGEYKNNILVASIPESLTLDID